MKALACVGMGKSEFGILDGFRSAGLEMDEICAMELTEEKVKEDYLFVFTVNFSPDVSVVCQNALIPYLSYIVELPQAAIYHSAIKNPCNFIFCFDGGVCQELQQFTQGRCFHLPLGAGNDCFAETVSGEMADITFVGSLCLGNKVYDKAKEEVSEYVRGYMEALVRTQVRIYGYNLLGAALNNDIVKELKQFIPETSLPENMVEGAESNAIVAGLLGNRVTELERQRLLKEISERFDIQLYTADDVCDILPARVHAEVSTWEERVKIYQNSRINLHLTHRSVMSGIPQEVFEIMAAGGFVLTNFQPELAENFVIGEHLETFVNEKDLLEKIAYYLEHEEERMQIAKAGQQAVREYHSYRARAIMMFNKVFSENE